MKQAIVIPACNEEGRLGATLAEYASFVQRTWSPDEAELIVVVNGSEDRTAAIARETAARAGFVRVIETPERLGKGGAVLRGFDATEADIMAFADADNSTPPGELSKLLAAVARGADVAIASRWSPGSLQRVRQPLPRRIAGRIFNQIVRRLFDLPFADTQCGAKAFRRESYRGIRSALELSGWAFDVEILVKLRAAGAVVVEVPVVWSDNSHSRLRAHRDGPAVLWELARLRWRLRRGPFDR